MTTFAAAILVAPTINADRLDANIRLYQRTGVDCATQAA
jgi:hypothetical protein